MHVCIFCVHVNLTNVCVFVNIKPSLYYLFQARKFKATGDLERAKRFDKYSFGFIIPGLVFIILNVVLFPVLITFVVIIIGGVARGGS